MKVLVCGGRDYCDRKEFFWQLTRNFVGWSEWTIISGCAKGADMLAVDFANTYNLECLKYPADWKQYGKAAGSIRNQQMLDEGKPDLVVAFKGGVGTADMVRRAKKAGVEVKEVA